MILLDTNVIIDSWRHDTEEARKALMQLGPCTFGAVLAELLHGASDDRHAVWIQRAISKFQWLEIYPDVWRRLGRNMMTLRQKGLTIPFPDVLLATMAIVHDVPVWSHDKHFALMQRVLPALQLYAPETES